MLYPNDATEYGKELRLKQQYFFVSASMQVRGLACDVAGISPGQARNIAGAAGRRSMCACTRS